MSEIMSKLSVSKFSVSFPHDLIIKLEAEKETIGIKSRSKMIEKCIRHYFDNKEEEKNIKQELEILKNEIEKIKEKVYLV
jgi:metal-responsive CopG/Arc/MetJ family transcriptional regulator